jgi:hypothetical protein
MAKKITNHEALIYGMILVSASDSNMTDAEMARIGRLTHFLPVFKGFDEESLIGVARDCSALLQLPEIAAADLAVAPEELRVLALIRDRLGLDKLTCAAIERGAIARFRTA